MSKINLRIISKPHAHLQSMVKTSVKFQKNWNKTVGGVAHKVHTSIGRRKDGRNDGKPKTMSLRGDYNKDYTWLTGGECIQT